MIQNRKDQGRIVSKNLTNLTSIKSFKKLTSYKVSSNNVLLKKKKKILMVVSTRVTLLLLYFY